MSLFSQVAWKEGMFMVPQHFQQAERSLEASLELKLRGLHPLGWGIRSLELNETAIAHGRIEVLQCRAVLPDGVAIDIPTVDAAPPPRTFALGPDTKGIDVFLSLPTRRARVPLLTRDEERADIRFLEREIKAPDEYVPERVQPIKVAVKNLRLTLSGEPLDGRAGLRIARIERNAEGVPALVPDYMPPCLHVSAAPRLERLLRELTAAVESRARSLTNERRQRTGEAIEFNADDILSFWFLHTLNAHLSCLKQLVHYTAVHPFTVYQELLRLAGALSTFEKREVEMPPYYEHDDLAGCFTAADRVLRHLLGQLFVLKYEVIPMVKTDSFWTAAITDRLLLESGGFLLAVIGNVKTEDAVLRILNTLKIADQDDLDRVVAKALAGLPFVHMARVPAAVPTRHDACYFQLKTDGPLWEKIRSTGQIAAYLPAWLPNVRLELVGIRGGAK